MHHALAPTPAAETALLGSLLKDPTQLSDVAEALAPDCFYVDMHRQIYQAFLALADQRQIIDIVAVADHLRSLDTFDQEQLTGALIDMLEAAPIAQNVLHYAGIVQRDFILRKAMFVCRDIIRTTEHFTGSAEGFLDQAESIFNTLRQSRRVTPYHSMIEALESTLTKIEETIANGGKIVGVPTGFRDLDALTGGFRGGHLVVLAARPGMGKTALGLNFTSGALAAGKSVMFFSLEMTKEEIISRMISATGMIDAQRLMNGNLSEEETDRVMAATRILGAYHPRFGIDDTQGIDISSLRRRARRFKEENGLDMIIVDYLQMLYPEPGRRFESHALAVGSISKALKELAKELKIPVLALAQLNRDLEKRKTQLPKASDLKDSGSIEADADQIFLIYRDEAVNPGSMDAGFADLIVGKNRHGPSPAIRMAYHANLLKFTSLKFATD